MPQIDLTVTKSPANKPKNQTKPPDLDGMKPVEKIKILFQEHLNDILRNEITGEWEIDGATIPT